MNWMWIQAVVDYVLVLLWLWSGGCQKNTIGTVFITYFNSKINSGFCTHNVCVCVCSIWFAQWTAIISLNSIKRLVVVAEMQNVFCVVGFRGVIRGWGKTCCTSSVNGRGQLHVSTALPRGTVRRYPLSRRMIAPLSRSGRELNPRMKVSKAELDNSCSFTWLNWRGSTALITVAAVFWFCLLTWPTACFTKKLKAD
jgi:hypothetical protein